MLTSGRAHGCVGVVVRSLEIGGGECAALDGRVRDGRHAAVHRSLQVPTRLLQVVAGGGVVNEAVGYELRDHGLAALPLLFRLTLPALLLLLPALGLRPVAQRRLCA